MTTQQFVHVKSNTCTCIFATKSLLNAEKVLLMWRYINLRLRYAAGMLFTGIAEFIIILDSKATLQGDTAAAVALIHLTHNILH